MAGNSFIDKARTPLIISGKGEDSTKLYEMADFFVSGLKKKVFASTDEKEEQDDLDCDYYVDEKARTANLTARGIEKAEKFFAYQKRDFNDLSVSFLCIATDITTSDPIVFEEGSLARAIRSSMSIPFLFAPVDYNDKLLCDGGLLNNFPVKNLREKGADIVIGVDLESEYIEKNKLDNSLKILERLIAVVSQHESNVAREQCDILK